VNLSPLLRPVKERNTLEQTIENLLAAVRLGAVGVGERLPAERDLSVQLGVSRMTLRAALQALADRGVVETRRGRAGGTTVVQDGPPVVDRDRAALRRADVLDLLAYRAVVEPGAAELAAARDITAADRMRLTDRLVDTTARKGRAARLADIQLHVLIGELSGSSLLAAAVAEVQIRLDDVLTALSNLAGPATADAQNGAVVRRILAGRAVEARRAMCDQLGSTASLILDALP